MKKLYLFMILCFLPATALAKKSTYVYTDRKFNFVKIEEMDKKANHPFSFTSEQMRAILKGIKLNRSFVLKKEVETQEVFSERAVGLLAPKFVEAFSKAGDKDGVIFSYLEKDPAFFVRNDRITIGSMWVEGAELHIKFEKLLAKMTGDYDKRGSYAKAVARARGLRISLEPQEGQMLAATGTDELIVDTNYNFAKSSPPRGEEKGEGVQPQATILDRLRELDKLKEEGLITEKEYKSKKKELLKSL